MAGQLAHAPASRASRPVLWLLMAITAAGLLLIFLYGLRIVSTAALVAVPTALFLAVYLAAMVAGARVLRGPVRLASVPAAVAVGIVLAFCGWALAVPAAVALAVSWRSRTPACRSLILVGWKISANVGRHVRTSADARGWRWEITRGAEVMRVVIEVSGNAWSTDPLSLPDDTRHALETDGRAERLKVLDQDTPPSVIRCGSSGCSHLSASEAGE